MKLTSQQEEQLINQYSRKIWKLIGMFGNAENCEDLYQEAVLEFLRHIRKVQTFRELRQFPTETIRNALCRYIIGQQVVSYPQRTSDFSKKVRMARKVGLETLTDLIGTTDDEWARLIDLKDYLNTLPADTLDMIQSRNAGEDNNSIAKRHHMTPGGVTHRIQRALKNYYDTVA